MSYVSPEGIVIPAGGDNWNLTTDLRTQAASTRSIVVAADRAGADTIVAAMSTDGRPASDTNPIYIHNLNLKGLEFKGSDGIWRPNMPVHIFGHMGRTAGFQSCAGQVKVIMDAAQELRGGVTFDNANDALVAPITGRYRIHVKAYWTGGQTSNNQAGIYINGAITTTGTSLTQGIPKPDVWDSTSHATGIVALNAGDKVATWCSTPSYTWGTTGYDGAYLEIEYVSPL